MYTETTNERVSGRDGGATERGLKCCQRTPRGGQHSYVPGIRLALHNTAQVSYWYWYLVSISPQFAIFAIFALARGKFDRLPGISIMFYVPACNLWAERRWEEQLGDVIARFVGWIYVCPPVTLCYRHCWQIQIIPLPGSSQQWCHNRCGLPLANTKRFNQQPCRRQAGSQANFRASVAALLTHMKPLPSTFIFTQARQSRVRGYFTHFSLTIESQHWSRWSESFSASALQTYWVPPPS